MQLDIRNLSLQEADSGSVTFDDIDVLRDKAQVSAKKLRADEGGTQKVEPMDDWVDIGVLCKDDRPLYLKKHRIRSGEASFTIEVGEKPLRAGIDPVVKLIDRRPDDNSIAVTRAD